MSSSHNKSIDRYADKDHPSKTLLAGFVQGKLDECELDRIETHLHECPTCCEALAALSRRQDRFVAELVSAANSTGHAAEATPATGLDAPGHRQAPSSSAATPQPLPRMIGRFRIREQIGYGGFGVVLLADDPQLRREVAIKIPRPGPFFTSELRERFLREAQAAAALDHPNIVPIHEAGEADGVCFIASGYCRGPNLSVWLKEQRQPVGFDTAARLVAQLADAIAHAHARGVLHRDLKPSNVLLEENGDQTPKTATSGTPSALHHPPPTARLQPKITDFGLAKLDGDGPDTTRSNVVMGTAGYMSPEQARGKAKEIGAATDIYSLGAILYELLIGRPPLVGESDVETLQRVQTEEPIPPVRLRPKMPHDLATICMKCLEKEPRRRYASAAELADELRRFLDGQPIHARPIGTLGRMSRWCRRNPVMSVLSAGLAVSLLLIVGIAAVMAFQINRDARLQRDRKYAECLSYLAHASASRHKETAGHRLDSLELLERAGRLATDLEMGEEVMQPIRDEAIACMTLVDLELDRNWQVPIGRLDPHRFAFDRALERCALLQSDQRIVILGLDTQPPTASMIDPGGGGWDRVAISPNGQFVVATQQIDDSRRVVLWELDDGEHTGTAIEARGVVCFAFSADSECLWLVGHGGTIWRYDLNMQQLSESARVDQSPRGCCLDHGNTRMAVWNGPRVDLVELSTGRVTASLVHPENDEVQCAEFSPDDRWLVCGGSHHLAYAWHVEANTESPIYELKGHQSWVTQVAFSPDGDLLATSSLDGTTRLWDYRAGRTLVVGRGYAVSFGDHSRRLAALLGDSVAVLRAVGSAERRNWHGPSSSYEMTLPTVSVDGLLAAGMTNGGVEFWECEDGRYVGHCTVDSVWWAEMRQVGRQRQLLTGSNRGVEIRTLRWNTAENKLQFDEPQLVEVPEPLHAAAYRASLSGNGQVLAIVDNYCRGYVIDLGGSRAPRRIDDPQLDQVRLSADGQWLATFDSSGEGILVRSAATGAEETFLLPDMPVHSAVFSPNGAWLVVDTSSELVFFRTGTWDASHRTVWKQPGVAVSYRRGLSFTPGSDLLAVSRPSYEIRLVDPADGHELATLPSEVPEPSVCFPNASRLLCSGPELTIQAWHLSLVRKQLAAMGLNW